jgi:hypothetical protein
MQVKVHNQNGNPFHLPVVSAPDGTEVVGASVAGGAVTGAAVAIASVAGAGPGPGGGVSFTGGREGKYSPPPVRTTTRRRIVDVAIFILMNVSGEEEDSSQIFVPEKLLVSKRFLTPG